MIEFKLGTNFDKDIIPIIGELNKKHVNKKITEVYGSIRRHGFYAARPHFRLPEVDLDSAADFIEDLHKINVEFNYTLNSIFPGSKRSFYNSNLAELTQILFELKDIGVDRITISNPFLFELIKELGYLDKFQFEVSTIAHLDTVSQIKYYYDKYGITKFCGNLLKNRNFQFLRSAAKFCNDNNLKYEVMVNEFCSVGNKTILHIVFIEILVIFVMLQI